MQSTVVPHTEVEYPGSRLWILKTSNTAPISQPALMCTPQWVERAMAEPTVLVTPMHSAPPALAYSSACGHPSTRIDKR